MRGETHVREAFSAVADTGVVDLWLEYDEPEAVMWLTAVNAAAGAALD
jgi:hypothetical protein